MFDKINQTSIVYIRVFMIKKMKTTNNYRVHCPMNTGMPANAAVTYVQFLLFHNCLLSRLLLFHGIIIHNYRDLFDWCELYLILTCSTALVLLCFVPKVFL